MEAMGSIEREVKTDHKSIVERRGVYLRIMRQYGLCGYIRVVFEIMTEGDMASCYITAAYAAGNSSRIRLNGELEDVLTDQRDPQKMESFDYSGSST
jgi:hypothetical protein